MLDRIIKKMQWLDIGLLKFQKAIVIIFGTFMAFAITGTVVSRLLFKNSLLGLEEVVLISAIWFYMIGAAIAASERSHLKVEVIPMIVKSKKALAVINLVIAAFVLVVACFMCYLCHDLLMWAIKKKTALPATRIPSWVPQSSFLTATFFFHLLFPARRPD